MEGQADLNRALTFVRVVESGSFTQAALALGLPKSSVSRSVAELERSLGVRLLQRTTRKLHLTDAGRIYFDKAQIAVRLLTDAESRVAELGTETRGSVRLSLPPDLGDNLFGPIVTDFSREHPKVNVEVLVSSRRVDLVQEGIDLAVRGGPLEDSSLVAQKVGTSDLALYASREYVKAKGTPKTLADLAEHECVLYRERGSARWTLSGPNGDESVIVRGSISSDDMVFVYGAIASGAGISLVPVFRGCTRLLRVLPEYAIRGAPVHVVTPSVRHESAAVAAFREYLVKRLSSLSFSGGIRGRD
jgi:DNA-binding transcriptional LysR family regulator